MNTWRKEKIYFYEKEMHSKEKSKEMARKLVKKILFLERNALGKKTMTNKNVTLREKTK